MERLDWKVSSHARRSLILQDKQYLSIVSELIREQSVVALSLYEAKLYLMDDGRWLILDYLNIPDAPRHYIDCIEGNVCNMNVRIVSDETKREIEKNQEIFNDGL